MKVFPKLTGAVVGLAMLSAGIWAAAKYEIGGSLFSTNYMPHAHCYLLEPGLIWTNATTDGLIWISYVGIAVSLVVLLHKTRNLLLFRWVFVAFGLFIVACGFTHFFEVVTLWTPLYWLSTTVKIVTAAASVVTAVAFAPLVPRAAEAIRLYQQEHSKREEQRVEALSKLLDVQERMKLAVESAGLGTWERNLITDELYCDDRCRALLGFDNHQPLTFQDFLSRVHAEDRAHVEAAIAEALALHSEYNNTFRVVIGDSELRYLIARGKLFYDAEGKPVRSIGTVIDVTRERQAEEALVRSEKLAVAGRMAASVAHEINNPLASALGLVYLARNDVAAPQHIRQYLETVEQELNRAGQITRSTLTFYRESPTPLRTNLVELVESVLTFQQGNLRRAGIALEKAFIESQPIEAFPGELRQVLTNLVSNAVEALQGKNGKLVVRVHPVRDGRTGREGYRIIVADNGPGIPEAGRKKLFEPFYTTKGEKGTGLGLWITSQLVLKHGGFIRFRSRCATPERSGGTVFSVWLPLAHKFANPVGSSTAA